MKQKVLNLGFGLISVILFFSCLDDSHNNLYVSYGVIQNVNTSNDFEIFTDKGNTLIVTKSHSGQKIENDRRVLVNYEILSDKDKNNNVYQIKVNGFYDLLSKPLVNESFILQDEEARRDSIGNDPFIDISAMFGGEYLNINFEMWYSQNYNKKHMINLVYDDTRADSDTIHLTLFHNAFDELPVRDSYLHRGIGRCSFKISDLLPAGVTSKQVKLSWLQYNRNDFGTRERSYTGIYRAGEFAETESSLSGQFNSYVEVK